MGVYLYTRVSTLASKYQHLFGCCQKSPMSSPAKIVAEYAKSSRSSCKKCAEAISVKALRMGLVSRDQRGYDATKWYHMNCFPDSVSSTEAIEGFESLQSNDQESLTKMAGRCIESTEEVHKTDVDEKHEPEEKNPNKTKVHNEDKIHQLDERSSKKAKKSPASSSPAKVVVEYAKSNRSSCKICAKTIASKTLRLGLVTTRGYDMTTWHHLDCFPMSSELVPSAEAIDGFASLKSSDQEALKNLVDQCDKSMKEVRNGEEIHQVDERSSKKAKKSQESSAPAKVVVEYAKSNRSSCKICTKTITSKTLRLGLVTNRGYDMTTWHHLDCFPMSSELVPSAEAIDGFASLKSSDQEAIKKLVDQCDKSMKEVHNEDKIHQAEEKSSKKAKKSPASSSPAKVVVEYAKSNRSSCKICEKTITSKTLRLGLVTNRGYDRTTWHHLDCFPTSSELVPSAKAIDGFASLKGSDQEALEKLVGQCDTSMK